jgi:hypothetical protein
VEDTLSPQKKTSEAIRQEVTREVDQLLRVIFQERRKAGRLDLEAIEMAVRSATHHAGATALRELLQFPVAAAGERSIPCPCGHHAVYQELRSKPVLTAVGRVMVSRPYYLCPHCHRGQFPADVEQDIENTEFSPGVRRMHAVVGQQTPFDQGRQQMKLLADLEVTSKAVERTAEAIGEDIAAREQIEIQRAMQLGLPMVVGQPIPVLYTQIDGTGVPVVKKETVRRQGKTEGQPVHTREAKLGCVFTKTIWDKEGYAIRDPDSTTYVGAIETAEKFGKRIYLEAFKRGWSRAEKKVVMGDGAEWIWNLADQYFPGTVQIVDLFHAREHLWELARKLYPNGESGQNRWMMIRQDLLDNCKIKKLVTSLRSIQTPSAETGGKAPDRGGVLSPQCPAHALSEIPPPTPVCRYRRHRSRVQDSDRFPLQTVRYVLDRAPRQCDPGSGLLSMQWPIRGLLGGAASLINHSSPLLRRTPRG